MKGPRHALYIAGSGLAAAIAGVGIGLGIPALYGIVPGVIGALMALAAAIRLFRDKRDLSGFIATSCGFVFYQAYQANPVTLPDFASTLALIPVRDQVAGIVLANLTTALLLLAVTAVRAVLGGTVAGWVRWPSTREF